MASAENEIIIVMCGPLDVMEKVHTHTRSSTGVVYILSFRPISCVSALL